MFVATKLPENTKVSGWVQMLPERTPNPSLSKSINVDVAIIGAGFAGLSAARRLSQCNPKLRVAVLEAGEIAAGAAGRNSGFIIDLPHEVSSDEYAGSDAGPTRRHIMINRTAIQLASDVAQERGWGKDVFDPCGKYNIAMSAQGDEHISSYAKQLDALKEPYRLLDSRQVADVTGTTAFTSAIFTPGTIIVQPAAYVRGLADSLKGGVKIYEKTPALSLEAVGKEWRIKTPQGAVTAGKVILANNGHAESFGIYRGLLMHVFTYASMTEEFSPARLGGDRSWAATPAFPMGTTVRRVRGERGDRILIRSRYTYNPRLKISENDVERAGRVHDRKFDARFPTLKGVQMEHRWGGAMALTWNGVPAYGEIESGLFAACACNGVGATKATALGIAAADSILGIKSELLAAFGQFEAPKSLPPQPFLTIGAKANLGFREWRAGKE